MNIWSEEPDLSSLLDWFFDFQKSGYEEVK